MPESVMRVIGYILISVGLIAILIAILEAVKAASRALERSQSPLLNRLPSVFLGLVLIAGCLWLWIYLLGNPINELALIRRGVAARAACPIGQLSQEKMRFTCSNGNHRRFGSALKRKKPGETIPNGFALCARQGAFTWRWKSSTDPARGSVS